MVVLKANNIYKEFKIDTSDCKVLNGVNVDINNGDFVVIMGNSGAGKSTLLYILSALEKPTSGKVSFEGIDLFELNDEELCKLRRNEFGFVFQFYNLIETLNVEENIKITLEFNGISQKKYKEKLDFLIQKMGLEDKRKCYPYQLSGGQQQRVAIARALVSDPKIIFADEPTGNLDSATGEEVLNLLKSLNRDEGKTIIMVTHDPYVASFGNKLIKIRDGAIVDFKVKTNI